MKNNTKKKEVRPSFNEWAKKMNVSVLWQEDTYEKKMMMERIRNARFAAGLI